MLCPVARNCNIKIEKTVRVRKSYQNGYRFPSNVYLPQLQGRSDFLQPRFAQKTAGGEEAFACFTPVWTWFVTLPTYGKFAFTDDKVLLTLPPRPFSTKIATTAMRAKISAYSTKLWPLRDFNPRYILRRVLFISFTSSSGFFVCSTIKLSHLL